MAKQEKKDKTEKKSKKTLTIILAAVILAIASAGATYYLLGKNYLKAPGPPAGTPLESFELGEMLVNLSDQDANHYLCINPVLEYEKGSKLKEELKEKKFILKDMVITTIRRKTSKDLAPAGSIQTVREEIKTELNKELAAGKILKVSFNVYLVQ